MGYPSRVTLGDAITSNGFILMDTPTGDGVEALVSLKEQNMVAFVLRQTAHLPSKNVTREDLTKFKG